MSLEKIKDCFKTIFFCTKIIANSKNNTYYIVCNKGTESLSCTKILNALGYNCYSVAGGIDDLKKL